MKRILLFCQCLIIGLMVFGSKIKTFDLNFDLNDFEISCYDGCISVLSRNHQDYTSMSKYGLPVRRFQIVIPSGYVVDNMHIHSTMRNVIAEEILGIRQFVLSSEYEHEEMKDSVMMSQVYEGNIPSTVVFSKVTDLMKYQEFSILNIGVCPFEFDADKEVVYFTPEVQLSLTLEKQVLDVDTPYISEVALDFFKTTILNSEDLPNSEEYIGDENIDNDPIVGIPGGIIPVSIPIRQKKYAIITSGVLAPAFSQLLAWKQRKGLDCKLITVEEIMSTYDEPTSIARIRHWIKDFANGQVAFILLGGDEAVIPIPRCYGSVFTFKDKDGIMRYKRDNSIPTDLYYACLSNTESWDDNNNGLVGEVSDNINLVPDVYVTRVPLFTCAQIDSFCSKVISYEQNPQLSWKILTTGAWDIDDIEDERNDGQYAAKLVFKESIAPYWDGYYVDYFDTFDMECTSPSKIINQFNQSYPFIGIYSHGLRTEWTFTEFNQFNIHHVDQIVNSRPGTFITTIACLTNNFDRIGSTPDLMCLSQRFLENHKSGIVGYWGSSRAGWSFDRMVEGPSLDYDKMFYSTLLKNPDECKSFGRIAALTKSAMIGSAADGDAYRWLMFAINPVGDPETPIFVRRPNSFSNVKLTKTSTMIGIDSGEKNALVCVSGTKNGMSFCNVYKQSWYCSTTSLPDQFSICITKQNFRPYTVDGKVLLTMDSSDSIMPSIKSCAIEENTLTVKMKDVPSESTAIIILTHFMGHNEVVMPNEGEVSLIDISRLEEGLYIVSLSVDGVVCDNKKLVIK